MKRIVVVAALLLAASLSAAQTSGYNRKDDRGYIGKGYALGGSSAAPEVITQILSTRLTLPSTVIPESQSYYDVVNAANDGTTIKYGYVTDGSGYQSSDERLVDGYKDAEYTTGSAQARIPFMWFSLNGVNVGDKIVRSKVYAGLVANSSTFTGEGYYGCRVDTLTSDYNMLDYPSISADLDTCRMPFTFAYMDGAGAADPWVPALNARNDMWKFGIRSPSLLQSELGTSIGDSIVFDITDAIQAIAITDQATIDRGVIVSFYSINSAYIAHQIAAGTDAVKITPAGGNPALTITTSTATPSLMWDDGKIPVVLVMDDTYEGTPGFFTPCKNHVDFSMAVAGNHWRASADSLWGVERENIDFLYHSLSHQDLGVISSASINNELAKENFFIPANFVETGSSIPDTNAINFCWPTETYTLEAMWKIVRYAYLGARSGAPNKVGQDEAGGTQPLSWDGYSNIYGLSAWGLGNVLDDGGPITDRATISDNLMFFVGRNYIDYGRSAAIFYGHDVNNGITGANLATLIDIVEDTEYLKLVSMSDLISGARARGLKDVDVVVAELNALRTVDKYAEVLHEDDWATAARHDSCATAEGGTIDGLFDLMWVGPGDE